MKWLIGLILLTLGLPAMAAKLPNMKTAIIMHECRQIDPAKDHFTCHLDTDYHHIDIEWQISTKALRKLPTKERQLAWYHYSQLAMHVVQYGSQFILGWPDSPRGQLCRQWHGVDYIKVGCYPFE